MLAPLVSRPAVRPGWLLARQVPHVWVEQERLGLILDATLSDVVPTGEMFKLKEQLRC